MSAVSRSRPLVFPWHARRTETLVSMAVEPLLSLPSSSPAEGGTPGVMVTHCSPMLQLQPILGKERIILKSPRGEDESNVSGHCSQGPVHPVLRDSWTPMPRQPRGTKKLLAGAVLQSPYSSHFGKVTRHLKWWVVFNTIFILFVSGAEDKCTEANL